MNRFSIAAVTLAAALSVVPAEADSASVVVSAPAPIGSGNYQVKATTVAFGDLDIASSQGAATLLARIDHASRFICGEREGRKLTLFQERQLQTCRNNAVADAVASVNAPELTKAAAIR
jgi:UrcA family protein